VPASTRPSLRPLIFGGLRIREQLGRNAPREYEAMSIHVIASEAIVTAGAYGWIASLARDDEKQCLQWRRIP
jgi:hypothetical protein